MVADLRLVVLDEDKLDLASPWFDYERIRLALGDRSCPRQALRLMKTQPRTTDGDQAVFVRVVWVAFEGDSSVGLIDVEAYGDGSAGFDPLIGRRNVLIFGR